MKNLEHTIGKQISDETNGGKDPRDPGKGKNINLLAATVSLRSMTRNTSQ